MALIVYEVLFGVTKEEELRVVVNSRSSSLYFCLSVIGTHGQFPIRLVATGVRPCG